MKKPALCQLPQLQLVLLDHQQLHHPLRVLQHLLQGPASKHQNHLDSEPNKARLLAVLTCCVKAQCWLLIFSNF